MSARTWLESPLRRNRYGRRLVALGHGRELSTNRKRYLTDARTGTVSTSGVRIAWYEYGPEGSDTAEMTVVLIHGFTLAAEAFHLQVDYLREHFPHVRVLLVDLRGHGASEFVAIEECTVDKAADDVIAVIKDRVSTSRITLLGHSLGGPVSLAALRRMPGDLRERVAGLIEVSTAVDELAAAGLARLVGTGSAERMVARLMHAPDRTHNLRRLLRGWVAPVLSIAFFMRETDDELIDFHAALISETPNDTLFGFFDDLQEHEERSAAPLLQDLPGYVLVGEKDYVTPQSQAQRLLELWPNARYQVAHDAGHMLPLEAPGIVNAALGRLLGELGV